MEFGTLCAWLEAIERKRPIRQKQAMVVRLLASARADPEQLYGLLRLLIPKRDAERQHYNMKESALALVLMHALGISTASDDGLLLVNWKQMRNSAAGDFAAVATQVICKRQQQSACQLSVLDLNLWLDHLRDASTREERSSAVRHLIDNCTMKETKWIIRIIMKDLKIGIGESSILDALHPDAKAMMGTCVDLKRVCFELYDSKNRFIHQDVILGKCLKSQHSKRMSSVDYTWETMKGKRIFAEHKFDGDRMQVHKDGNNIWFWSRNGKEHKEYAIALQKALDQSILSKRFVLDGELLIRDINADRFMPRTRNGNRDAARASRKGLESDDQICYVIFDILYEGEQGSLLHHPLCKRRELLRMLFSVDSSPQIFCTASENCKWFFAPTCKEDLENFFWTTVESGGEGIVVKDLDSQWYPDNRDGRWCKIKPDYVFVGNDLDLLIIGGYYGTGSRGGMIASFLMALVEQDQDGNPARFVTLCRCGTGFTEDDLSLLMNKLSPYYVVSKKGGMPPPACGYLVANSRYERPDVWISKPEMSIVLQISAEQRIYQTQTFKAGWTFRFPRVVKIRYDKSWMEALSIKEFEELVNSAKDHGNSLLHGPRKYNPLSVKSQKKGWRQAKSKKHLAVLPHLSKSKNLGITSIAETLHELVFFVCNGNSDSEKSTMELQIQLHGGKTVANLLPNVTHVLASQKKGLQYEVAANNGRDIIDVSWLFECLKAKRLLPILPRHYLHQSDSTRNKLKSEIDRFGDPWFEPSDIQDLVQVLNNIDSQQILRPGNRSLQRLLKRPWIWGIFEGVRIYVHKIVHSVNPDSQLVAMVTLRRLLVEAEMRGVIVSPTLNEQVTHVIVYCSGQAMQLLSHAILSSFNEAEKALLVVSPHMLVVSHTWIEDCLQKEATLDTGIYTLALWKHGIESDLIYTTTQERQQSLQKSLSFQSPDAEQQKMNEVSSNYLESIIKDSRKDILSSKGKMISDSSSQASKKSSPNKGRKSVDSSLADSSFLNHENCLAGSRLIWESESIQDIAKTFIGSIGFS